ncbi:hypothetical protein [Corynebacterium pelargi]|uniref:Uncharacterized protein n=1 Tax=Corynebacterium pelargi TaxID=1471400 RepID=A0A410W9J9_9CORY|nr:hypothetical protein [Corynebacterium pelargi]QAU52627.1 hypothetical protein CPELA_06825 [Corynebacterium pelargi]GGG77751.1 hypothetical protein GCM10007338_14560 [Corynebacterium pelargi]
MANNKKHAAGAFDIRNFIGLLIGIYGIVLVICSFVLDPGTNPDTGALKNSADNLYAGVAMLLVGAAFMLWAKMKPIVVDESKIDESALPGGQ